MALTKRKTKVDPTAFYIAWQGIAVDIDGIAYTASRGDRFRGDHPLVQRAGETAFVPDGTPQYEWPTPFDAAVEAAEAEAKAAPLRGRPSRIDPKTPISELLVAHTEIVSSRAGSCGVGRIVRRDDPLALVAPECFRPLIETLG